MYNKPYSLCRRVNSLGYSEFLQIGEKKKTVDKLNIFNSHPYFYAGRIIAIQQRLVSPIH